MVGSVTGTLLAFPASFPHPLPCSFMLQSPCFWPFPPPSFGLLVESIVATKTLCGACSLLRTLQTTLTVNQRRSRSPAPTLILHSEERHREVERNKCQAHRSQTVRTELSDLRTSVPQGAPSLNIQRIRRRSLLTGQPGTSLHPYPAPHLWGSLASCPGLSSSVLRKGTAVSAWL